MKKYFVAPLLAVALFFTTGCEKPEDEQEKKCNSLPHNEAPVALKGGWANGFSSFTQIVDLYNGKFLGTTWQSGRYFKFTQNGAGAEFYYTAQSQFAKVATKANGTIAFDEGSDANSGSFVFHACSARYRSWGSTNVDRDASAEELQNNLTRRYFYVMDGNWLRIEPGAQPNAFSSSFRKVD